jgi:5'-nucleotidase
MSDTTDDVALVDLDGTIADFDGEMSRRMALLRSPDEVSYDGIYEDDDLPSYIRERRKLIKNQPGFWRNLPRLELGFQIVDTLLDVGFKINILSKGPRLVPAAWQEKFEWCCENVPYASITLTQQKSLTYGRILVDDFPDYFLPWLKVRPRGLVIAVAQPWNEKTVHPNLIRYDGINLETVRGLIIDAYARNPRSPFG